jgi:hypothetical protein
MVIVTKEQIRKVANEHKLQDTEVFVKFIQTRFPDEEYIDYIETWAYRFATGNPTAMMDSLSKSIYAAILDEVTE